MRVSPKQPLFYGRHEKLKELKEGIDRLERWCGGQGLPFAVTPVPKAIEEEEDSIAKADLFGEHLLGCSTYDLDPSTDNPFASYLRKLKAELDIIGVVDVVSGDLRFGSPLKFPGYDICRDELDRIANNSDSAKNQKKKIKDLEKGLKDLEKEIKENDDRIEEMGRPETYPEGVSEEDIRKEFRKWVKLREELGHSKDKLREEQSCLEMLIKEERDRITSLGDAKDIEEADSQETNSEIEKGGDDQ